VAERAFVAKRLTFLNLVLSMFAMSTEPQPLQAVRTRAAFCRFFAILRTRVACRAKLEGGLPFKGLVSSIGAFKAQIGARCVVCVYRAFYRLVIVVAYVVGRASFALSGLTFRKVVLIAVNHLGRIGAEVVG